MHYNSSILDEFVNEARDQLEKMEKQLLDLEKTEPDQREGIINTIFRSIHTIKGNAGFFNLSNISTLAHTMETLLSFLRSGEVGLTEKAIDLLINGVDTFNELINRITESDEIDISGTLGQFETLFTAEKLNVESVEKSSVKFLDMAEKSTDLPISRQILKLLPPEHDYLYVLKYDVPRMLAESRITPVKLVNHLLSLGCIVEGAVKTPYKDLHHGLPENRLIYTVLFSTVLDPDIIQEAVYLDSSAVFLVKIPEEKEKDEPLIIPEMVEKFREEALEQLDRVEKLILEVERRGQQEGIVDKPSLVDAYRLIHSLKGNAGFFEEDKIEELCMTIESLLEKIKVSAPEDIFNNTSTIFSSIDRISRHLNIMAGEEIQDEEEEYGYKPLGRILVDMGSVTEEQLEKALAIQEKRLGEVLLDERMIQKPDLEKALKAQNLQKADFETQHAQYRIRKKDIRVDMVKLDKLFELIGELVTAESMIQAHPDIQSLRSTAFAKNLDYFSKISKTIQEITMSIRMIPLEGLFNKMNRLVRDLAKKFHKEIDIQISGQETEMDRNVIDEVADPLIHIIRNAADHGIESPEVRKKAGKPERGIIQLSARHEGNEIWISIKDDGKGLDRDRIIAKGIEKGLLVPQEVQNLTDDEVWALIFEAGFSTAGSVSEISGRGVGMDVVKANVEKLHGSIMLSSTPGAGSTIILKIPLTLAIIEGAMVTIGEKYYAIPIDDVIEFHKARKDQITATGDNREVLKLRDEIIPIIKLAEFFRIEKAEIAMDCGISVICRDSRGRKAAFLVDKVTSYQQIVKKALPEFMGKKKGISGCSIMGNGAINLIIDTNTIIKELIG